MVTIVRPSETLPVESAPAPETPQPQAEPPEWRYSMPFAGVKYYSYRPAPRQAKPLPDEEATRPALQVQLIDERVILI